MRLQVPEEIISQNDSLLLAIKLADSADLVNSTEEIGGFIPKGFNVATKNIPVEMAQEQRQEFIRQYPFASNIGTKGSITVEQTYCSPLKNYEQEQSFDLNKGLAVVCKEIDELALIKELIPTSYAYLSSKWDPSKMMNTFKYVLPEGMENFSTGASAQLAQDFIGSLNYENSNLTTFDLFKRVNSQAIKIAISTILTAFEYLGEIKINPLKCSSSARADRYECLHNYLVETYSNRLKDPFLKEITYYHIANVPTAPKTTFKQDMKNDMAAFNEAVYNINFIEKLESKIMSNYRSYLSQKDLTDSEKTFIQQWGLGGQNGYNWTVSADIKNQFTKALLETRYGRLMITKKFSDYVGKIEFNALHEDNMLNGLSEYNQHKGEKVLTESLAELIKLTATSINELIKDRTEYRVETPSTKTTQSFYFKMGTQLANYLKTYPFAFRQYIKADPYALEPRSREFMLTMVLLDNIMYEKKKEAIKNYVLNGGAAIVGLALICTGAGAPYGLVVAGYATSALIIANTIINVDNAVYEKNAAKKGMASGARNIVEAYETIKDQSSRITNELINGAGEAFGLALIAGVAGAGRVLKLVSEAKATKYTAAILEVTKGKVFANADEFKTFMQTGISRIEGITNEKTLTYLNKNPEQLTYIQTKLASLDDTEATKLIRTLNESNDPEKTIAKILKQQVKIKTGISTDFSLQKYSFFTDATKDPVKQKALDTFFAELKSFNIDENTEGFAKLMDDLEATHTSGRAIADNSGTMGTNLSLSKGRNAVQAKKDLQVMLEKKGVRNASDKSRALILDLMDESVLANNSQEAVVETVKDYILSFEEINDLDYSNAAIDAIYSEANIGKFQTTTKYNEFKQTSITRLENAATINGSLPEVKTARLNRVQKMLDSPNSTATEVRTYGTEYQELKGINNTQQIDVTHLKDSGIKFTERVFSLENAIRTGDNFKIGYARGVLRNTKGDFFNMEKRIKALFNEKDPLTPKNQKEAVRNFIDYLKNIESYDKPADLRNYLQKIRPSFGDGELLDGIKKGVYNPDRDLQLVINKPTGPEIVRLGHSYIHTNTEERLLYLYNETTGKIQLLDEFFKYPSNSHAFKDILAFFNKSKTRLQSIADQLL